MTQQGPYHFGQGSNSAQEPPPLPNDLSQGWIPEDPRQTPSSPLPAPVFWGFQSLIPFRVLNGIRHPGELPILVIAYVVTLLAYIAFFFSIVFLIGSWLSEDTTVRSPRPGMSLISALLGQYVEQTIALLVFGPLIIFIVRALYYAEQRVKGVRLSPTQFPEGYQMLVEASRAAGLRRVPDAYVIQGGGTLNAFASGHGFRRFICIYSDMFEVGGKSRDPEALRYVIGHEVGHIAAGHVSYFRLIFTATFRQIPVLGEALSRAQEYTADNFGYRLSPEGARGGMKVLAGGKYLNKQVNFDEFADRAATEGGLAIWAVNLFSSHPVLTWRAHAIRDRQHPGRLFWRPRHNPPATPALIPAESPVSLWPDPLQAGAFMNEQKPAWEKYTLDTVQLYRPENPPGSPRITGTLQSGWQDSAARAAHAAYWEKPGNGQPGSPAPQYPPQPYPGPYYQQPPAPGTEGPVYILPEYNPEQDQPRRSISSNDGSNTAPGEGNGQHNSGRQNPDGETGQENP